MIVKEVMTGDVSPVAMFTRYYEAVFCRYETKNNHLADLADLAIWYKLHHAHILPFLFEEKKLSVLHFSCGAFLFTLWEDWYLQNSRHQKS